MSRAKQNAQAAYRWLKPEHIAKELDCSHAHVLALIGNGELPAYDLGAAKGSRRPEYRVRPEDYTAFLERRSTLKTA